MDDARYDELLLPLDEQDHEIPLHEMVEFSERFAAEKHRRIIEDPDILDRGWEPISGDITRACPLMNMPAEMVRRSDEGARRNGRGAVLLRMRPPCSFPDCCCFAAPTGTPGRPTTTLGLAEFANRKRPATAWKEIASLWNKKHPGEKTTGEKARHAVRRHFGDKKRVKQ